MTLSRSNNDFDEAISRRDFVNTAMTSATVALSAASLLSQSANGQPQESPMVLEGNLDRNKPYLTPAGEFRDVSRGTPKPFTLQGDALRDARLTAETWRLEVTADETVDDVVKQPAKIAQPLTIADGTAITLERLHELGREHGVKFIKAMQCLNIPTPLGQGLWEGVPLREVLKLCGPLRDVRRIAYWGFHNNEPQQMFRSSLSFTQAMETPPGELPPFLAYKLNGEPIPLERGGPVRMVIPWAHGFKSIKWLQQIVLTNDYRANDTYAQQNNDPESHLKTAAYIDPFPKVVDAGKPVVFSGLVISGLSGLKRVEYWLHHVESEMPPVTDDESTWEGAKWSPCELEAPPRDWLSVLPQGTAPRDVLGFDAATGQSVTWPMRYSMVSWSAQLPPLPIGKYEFRARAVDLNDYAQPDPRRVAKSGRNEVEVRRFEVK
ncbi:MAG: molybdopterin-dependent oxidoreductase [Planctomycetaceae bacterium]